MKSSVATKLTAYGRWHRVARTWLAPPTDNDVILTSVVVVVDASCPSECMGGRRQAWVARPGRWSTDRAVFSTGNRRHFVSASDRHNAICRGYGTRTMAALAIIGDELYRSVGEHGRRAHCAALPLATSITSSSSSSNRIRRRRNRLLSGHYGRASSSSVVRCVSLTATRRRRRSVIRVH